MSWQKFTRSLANIGLLIAIAMILLAVPILRESKGAGLIGREAYYLARIAVNLPDYDPLSYSGREATYNIGLPYLLNNIPEQHWKFVPFALAYLSIIIFWILLRQFGVGNKSLILLFVALSPTFLYLSSTLNRLAAPLLIFLLSFLLLYSENRLLKVLGILTFSAIPIFDFAFSLLALAILILFAFTGKRPRHYYLIAAITLAISTIAYFLYLFQKAGWPSLFNPERQFFGFNYALRAIVSDFGAVAGVSIIALILFALGVSSLWHQKYSRKDLFFLAALLIILSFISIEAVILLSLLVAAFAYIGFEHLLKSDWSNSTLKTLVLITFACGILFSAVAYGKELVESEPGPGVFRALEFLESKNGGVVFSDYSRGNWISYAGQKNVLDQNFLFAPQAKERYLDSRKLLTTRDYSTAAALIQKYGIKYIWIDDDMKNKLYSDNEDGLLFLLKYSSNITKIYNQGNIQVWQIGSLQ